MDLPNQQHPLSHLLHQPPTLSMRPDPPNPDLPPDEPAVNFKSYFNTL